MSTANAYEQLLVERIRQGSDDAWHELIARYEGRLLAFVDSRLRRHAASEDVVQEAFIGFLTSLPNYDGRRSLETYLFSIAAHKLTDALRREGRRPTVPLAAPRSDDSTWDLPGADRPASSILQSRERRDHEAEALVAALTELLARWQQRGDGEKIRVNELIFVAGLPNKEVARRLRLSEQTVANHKFELLAKLRATLEERQLPPESFPQLHEPTDR